MEARLLSYAKTRESFQLLIGWKRTNWNQAIKATTAGFALGADGEEPVPNFRDEMEQLQVSRERWC